MAPGVRHVRAWFAEGPWAIHLVEVDISRCQPEWQARKAGPPITARATTTALSNYTLAALNADFFAIPAGNTVGAHVSGGEVIASPGVRPVIVLTGSGLHAGQVLLDAEVSARSGSLRLRAVNRIPLPGDTAAHLFTRWFGATPRDSTAIAIQARDTGDGRAVVIAVDESGGELRAAGDTIVLLIESGRDALRVATGDTLRWRAVVRFTRTGEPALEVVGGFPLLIADGRDVLAAQPGVRPDFGEQRHPRSAIGFDDHRVFLVVVDGRQPPYSAGMSLPELTAFFGRLGVHTALNLDGGGSTALVINGAVVNRPSDREGERPVGNAFALVRCTRGR